MKKIIYSIFMTLFLFSCADKNKETLVFDRSQLKVEQEKLRMAIEDFRSVQSMENLQNITMSLDSISVLSQNLSTNVDKSKLSREDQITYDSMFVAIQKCAKDAEYDINRILTNSWQRVIEISDCLEEKGVRRYPVYLYKGDIVELEVKSNVSFSSVIFKNQESGDVLEKETQTSNFHKKMTISYSAIYLIELNLSSKQYVSMKLQRKANVPDNFFVSTSVKEEIVKCSKSDEGAYSADELQFVNIYEDPVKCTLASQGRALFGNSYRSVVSVQLPQGTTEWFYNLRLSTSKDDSYSDGKFCEDLLSVYTSKSIAGQRVYDKSLSVKTGIFDDMLNLVSSPQRDEEAYCNFFVIKEAKEARKFQNNGGNVMYNIDHSLKGTQSAKGHVPTEGRTSFYIGLENPRFTTSIYVWLEIVAVQSTTNWYKVTYKKE